MHGWNAPENQNLNAKGHVTLNATYTIEPEPQREDRA
jgi:hypothetical protein